MSPFSNRIAFLLALAIVGVATPGRGEGPPVFEIGQEIRAAGLTSISLAPAGDRLYGVTIFGALMRWKVDPRTGALSDEQTLELPHFQQGEAGPRGIIGMAFDPENPQTLWVSDNYPVPLTGKHPYVPDLSGRISRVVIAEGDAFAAEASTYLHGLPRSCADHVSNSLAFRRNPDAAGPAYLLYLAQGSNTAMGDISVNWCMRPERLLNAAILEIDPRRDPPPDGFDVTTEPLPVDGDYRRFGYTRVLRSLILPEHWGDLKEDPIWIDDGEYEGNYLVFDARGVASVRAGDAADSPLVRQFYDPFAPDAVARLYATGLRNAYDFVWHDNGFLYVAVNGASGKGHSPDDLRTALDEELSSLPRQDDILHWLARGDYAGHPNPLRDEFVLHGGNPTAGADPHEVEMYPVGVQPNPRYHPDRVYPLGANWSPTGTIVYRGYPGHSEFDGAVLFSNYSKGNNLRMITLDEAGAPAGDFFIQDAQGQEIVSPDPIDVALGAEGRIYVATLPRSNGRGKLLRLDPAGVVKAEGPAP